MLFEPGTVVNFESVFFGPRMTGLTYLIDTLMFKDGEAELASLMPRAKRTRPTQSFRSTYRSSRVASLRISQTSRLFETIPSARAAG